MISLPLKSDDNATASPVHKIVLVLFSPIFRAMCISSKIIALSMDFLRLDQLP